MADKDPQDGAVVRKIIHVDMDAFYASIEQRDNPDFRGKPVVVGGQPDSRGVVAAASYEAREFGIRSAMPSSQAARLCPDTIFVPPRFETYRAVSNQIRDVFHRYTDLVEPLSLDEAFLDVTDNKQNMPLATEIAEKIRAEIKKETGLNASAGIAPNKFLAKIASDLNKPNGQAVIPPQKVETFLRTLPVGKIFGIGPVTQEKLARLGIKTAGDLQQLSRQELDERFGKHGAHYFNISRGIDERPVRTNRERKSVSAEETFSEDHADLETLEHYLERISQRVADRLERSEMEGRTVTLKVKYDNFEQVTRRRTLDKPTRDAATMQAVGCELLRRTEAGTRAVRLLGLGLSNFGDDTPATPTRSQDDRQIELPLN